MKNPVWLRNAVIYNVFIDRFYRSRNSPLGKAKVKDEEPVFCGGDLSGVIEKLSYLEDLGINTIWLSPFTRTASYHGYHITDYFSVEERFGGNVALDKVLLAAKQRKMKVIMDFVPNHVHNTHPWFQSAKQSKTSPYRDWFYWKKNGDYLKFLNFQELPKLNLDNSACRREIIKAAKFWVAKGIDGFRLDHVLGASLNFWQEFRKEITSFKEDFPLIGEAYFWGIRREFLDTIQVPEKEHYLFAQQTGTDIYDGVMQEYVGVMDGLLDFQFQKLLKQHIARASSLPSKDRIQRILNQHYEAFRDDCSLISFLDNHDMNRFLYEAGDNKKKLIAAFEIQFSQACPAAIYNGTEMGMSQNIGIHGNHGDLQVRQMISWNTMDRSLVKKCKYLINKWKHNHTEQIHAANNVSDID